VPAARPRRREIYWFEGQLPAAEAVRRWRKDLTDEQVGDIRAIVSGSALLELWPELSA